MNVPHSRFLQHTYFLDYDHGDVRDFAAAVCEGKTGQREKAVALYYAVRDSIRYNPFVVEYKRSAARASAVLQKKTAYCVSKAVLLAAVCRGQGIPARLGFADVTNHLSTPKLKAMMGTNIFIYHGFTELFLGDRWVKATPAFNLSLCTRFRVRPLDFDGTRDSIFHEFDSQGLRHMEYIRFHGSFDDLPFERIFAAYAKMYPNFFKNFGSRSGLDFGREAETPE
jgi:transglutaminase-like putative cysteine protease